MTRKAAESYDIGVYGYGDKPEPGKPVLFAVCATCADASDVVDGLIEKYRGQWFGYVGPASFLGPTRIVRQIWERENKGAKEQK